MFACKETLIVLIIANVILFCILLITAIKQKRERKINRIAMKGALMFIDDLVKARNAQKEI